MFLAFADSPSGAVFTVAILNPKCTPVRAAHATPKGVPTDQLAKCQFQSFRSGPGKRSGRAHDDAWFSAFFAAGHGPLPCYHPA